MVLWGAATLASSCIVYTPDLLSDDAVSLGGGPSRTASSPAPAVPSGSSLPLGAVPTAAGTPSPAGPLQRHRFAPAQLGALVVEQGTDAADAGALEGDAATDSGTF